MNKVALFRVWGGRKYGFGHLRRSLAIAQKVKEKNITPVFLINRDTTGLDFVRKYGYKVIPVAETLSGKDISRYCQTLNPSLVIYDLKKDVTREIIKFKKHQITVCLLDNFTPARLVSDFVIYPVAHLQVDKLNWAGFKGKILSGSKFFPLDSSFFPYRKKSVTRKISKVPEIVLSFGGTDPNDLTGRVIKWLLTLPVSVKITVILGPGYKFLTQLIKLVNHNPRVQIVVNPSNLAERFAQATVVLTAFGITLYELANLGVPALIIYNFISDKHEVRRFVKFGTALSLGYYRTVSAVKIYRALQIVLDEKKTYHRLSSNGRRLVDGLGTERIYRYICNIVK